MYFKTSHVIVYPISKVFTLSFKLHFKTSHVIVYQLLDKFKSIFKKFQNISCYCLSKIVLILLVVICNFKTSHVIVYRNMFGTNKVSVRFQNISCYCLSLCRDNEGEKRKISKHLMLLFILTGIHKGIVLCEFQNISCYCLSLAFSRFLVSPLPFFPLYFLYFSIFYQPTSLSWTALLIIP